MKAEFIKLSSMWMKQCNKCKECFWAYTQDGLSSSFRRESQSWDGFCGQCKRCRSAHDQVKTYQRTAYRKRMRCPSGAEKNRIREIARNTFNKEYKCSVLNCLSKAEELHHVTYKDPLAVVPLCKQHHYDNHRVSRDEND